MTAVTLNLCEMYAEDKKTEYVDTLNYELSQINRRLTTILISRSGVNNDSENFHTNSDSSSIDPILVLTEAVYLRPSQSRSQLRAVSLPNYDGSTSLDEFLATYDGLVPESECATLKMIRLKESCKGPANELTSQYIANNESWYQESRRLLKKPTAAQRVTIPDICAMRGIGPSYVQMIIQRLSATEISYSLSFHR